MKKGDKVLIQKKARVGYYGQYLLVARKVDRVTQKQFVVGNVKYWKKDFSVVGKVDPWARNLTPACFEYDKNKDQTKLFNELNEKEKLRVSCRRYSSQIRNLMVDFSTNENEKISSDGLRDIESRLISITNYLNNKL